VTTPNAAVSDDSLLEPSDDDLVEAARGGDDSAYATLWQRHVASGRRAARAVSPSVDPDDLVSEAFTSILATIRGGGGPREGFRPYLFSTIRNIAASWGRRSKEQPLDDLDERPADAAVDMAEAVADRSVLAQAFRELPDRWRTLLWYLEVEGMKPREVAPLLGMSPNAVSALAYRAREGFRQAWLQAHVSDPRRPAECRWVCELLVAQENKKPVRRADRKRLDAHLRECQACRIVAADIADVSHKLRMILLPLVLGGAGAVAYIADATPAVALAVTGTPDWGGASGTGGSGAGGAAGGGAGAGGAGTTALPIMGIAGGVAAAGLAAAAAVVIAIAPWSPPADEGPGSADIGAPAVSDDAREPADRETDDLPAEAALPAPDPAPPVEPVVLPEADTAPDAAGPAPAPAPSPPPTPTPAPVPPPVPTPTPTPTPTPEPPAQTAAPVLDAQDTDATVPAAITGTGVPGALIEVIDERSATLAETTVGEDGRFDVEIPADSLREGMTVHAVQTAPGLLASAASAPIGPFLAPAPTVTSDDGTLEAQLVDADFDGAADDVFLLLDGLPGETAVVSVDGTPTGNRHVFEDTPLRRVVYDLTPGEHVIGIRYVDPATGLLGRRADTTILAIAPTV
jgi:RNA polymerase sigma factor (sigma-70 family)